MKIELDLKAITIKNRGELFEFIKSVNYLPSLGENLKGTENGDALEWDLMDFILIHFVDIQGLRSRNPNLIERLESFTTFMNSKIEEIKKTHELMKKYNDD